MILTVSVVDGGEFVLVLILVGDVELDEGGVGLGDDLPVS